MGPVVDAETGFVYLRARYYDPATGQFLTRDPIEAETREPYGYFEGDPLNGIDPSGLWTFSTRHLVTGPYINTGHEPSLDRPLINTGAFAGFRGPLINPGHGRLLDGPLINTGGDLGPQVLINVPSPDLIRQYCATENDPDQDALIQIAKDAKRRGGVTETEAHILDAWRREYRLPGHGTMQHPTRGGFGGTPHTNVGTSRAHSCAQSVKI